MPNFGFLLISSYVWHVTQEYSLWPHYSTFLLRFQVEQWDNCQLMILHSQVAKTRWPRYRQAITIYWLVVDGMHITVKHTSCASAFTLLLLLGQQFVNQQSHLLAGLKSALSDEICFWQAEAQPCFLIYRACADPENFVRGGSNLDHVFLVDEGWDDPNTTISGPSSARQRNAI